MSAIQDLAPFIGAYQGKIRRAKDASGMTLEELSNESGVSFSAVSRLYAGTQADPRLYNSAALCKTLGLSLDELFGLENRVGSPEKLTKQIHHVELENAKLEAATALQSAQIRSTHTMCYIRPILFAALLYPDCLPCNGCADSERRPHSRWRFDRNRMGVYRPDRRFSSGFCNYFLRDPKRTWRETWSASSVKKKFQTARPTVAGAGKNRKRGETGHAGTGKEALTSEGRRGRRVGQKELT